MTENPAMDWQTVKAVPHLCPTVVGSSLFVNLNKNKRVQKMNEWVTGSKKNTGVIKSKGRGREKK